MGNVFVKSGFINDILPSNGVTSNTTGNAYYKDAPKAAIQCSVIGTGAVTGTFTIQVSNDGTNWCATPAGTITLSGTSPQSDGFTTDAPWKYLRVVVSNLTGTGATAFANVSR